VKLLVLAALLAIGCGSKKDPGSGSAAVAARPAVTDPIGFCARARAAVASRQKCFPEDSSLKMLVESIAGIERDAPAGPEGHRTAGASCAVTLDGMARSEQPANCPLDVTDAERRELATFLAAWYGERTAPPKTGNAETDAALVTLAGQRDTACACKDLSCFRKAAKELDDHPPSWPVDRPKAAGDAATKMRDEVTRCKQKLEYGAPAP
jgi:hypothetical protein